MNLKLGSRIGNIIRTCLPVCGRRHRGGRTKKDAYLILLLLLQLTLLYSKLITPFVDKKA